MVNNNTTKTKSDGIGCSTCGEKIVLKKLHVRVVQILHLIIDFVIPDNGTKIRLNTTKSKLSARGQHGHETDKRDI